MRVERGEHAVDRALDQRMVVDLVDIIGADPLEHAHERFELLVGVDVGRGERAGGHRDQRQRADQREGRKQLATSVIGSILDGHDGPY